MSPLSAFVLALALAWLQLLGSVHHVVHGTEGGIATAADAELHGLTESLFGLHEDGDTQCRLFDQLVHGDALGTAAEVVVAALPPRSRVTQCVPASPGRRQARAFLARGPPA